MTCENIDICSANPFLCNMTDILAQRDSTGIYYEPYQQDFKLCIYEEPNVMGRNERYEFRCDAHLSCCGRVCGTCVEAAYFPLWLLILLLFLALLLLLALLYLLYRLCCRKKRDKEVVKRSTTTSRRRTTRPYYGEAGYRSIERDDDRERLFRDRASYTEMPNGHAKKEEIVEQVNTSGMQRSPFRRSFHEEETFEEEFHEEIEVEQGGKVAEVSSLDSRPPMPAPIVEERKPLVPLPSPKPTPPRVIPSPMEEIQLEKPRPIRAVERELGSRQSLATVVSRRSESPQRAQHAFYRPIQADPVDELQLPIPARVNPQFGDTRELLGGGEKPVEKVVDGSEPSQVHHMFVRPGFDNAPAY